MIPYLPEGKNLRLLDLATGTGDQLFTLIKKEEKVGVALGLDLSEEMLFRGQKKLIDKPYAHRMTLMKGDATDISLKDEAVDCVTISFGIRNVSSVEACLKESYRVLAPGGRFLVLEFSLPKHPFLKRLHLFYLRYILPTIGGVISRRKKAYLYLNRTIESFPYGKAFCSLLEQQKFMNVKAIPLTFGIATLYVGEKSCLV